MLASQQATSSPGIDVVSAVQGTPLNKGMLEMQGFDLPSDAGPNDLVIAVRASDKESLEPALAVIEEVLTGGGNIAERPDRAFRSWRELKHRDRSTSLAMIAVAGRYAAGESAAALEADLDVFCFSDGVPVDQEVALKTWARSQGRLFMGPDCGTAIIGGLGLGFSNRVARGPVGIVGASGTGVQELCCLLDRSAVGVSHAIGVGSRDLSDAVGGLMALEGLDLLAQDRTTEIVVVVSKPPDTAVASRLMERAERVDKPVVLAFMGSSGGVTSTERVKVTASLEEAASAVGKVFGTKIRGSVDPVVPPVAGYVRGFFCGGTLCYLVQSVLAAGGIEVRSNAPLDPALSLQDPSKSDGHTLVDMGDDAFTDGRLHPMIDPSLRDLRLGEEARDPEVGVVVCDVVLGDGAHPDPATDLARRVAEVKSARGEDLQVVVCLCGTAADPQGFDQQQRVLAEAGAFVTTSSESAGRAVLGSMKGAS
jgi:FdrA protein